MAKARAKTGGRKKGTPNKLTAAVKAALDEAFAELGGVPGLVKWGKKNQTEFYRLWIKLLPTEIKNADGETFKVQIVEEIVDADDSKADPTPPRPSGVPPK